MGFMRDEVESAMQAAFNKPDRAADYLINVLLLYYTQGIPQAHEQEENSPEYDNDQMEPDEDEPAPMPEMDNLGYVERLRERIRNDPNYFQTLLQELQTSNPILYEGLQNDPRGPLQALLDEEEPIDPEPEDPNPPQADIQVTEEEKASIERVY